MVVLDEDDKEDSSSQYSFLESNLEIVNPNIIVPLS